VTPTPTARSGAPAPCVPRPLAPPELRDWLEWAGERLLALHVGPIKPRDSGVIWPDYVQELNVFEPVHHGRDRLRPASPPPEDITIMEEILRFPALCTHIAHRRVLHLRALIKPINGRHVYSWTQIAEKLHSDREQIRRAHAKALREAASKAPASNVCRIRAYLTPAA